MSSVSLLGISSLFMALNFKSFGSYWKEINLLSWFWVLVCSLLGLVFFLFCTPSLCFIPACSDFQLHPLFSKPVSPPLMCMQCWFGLQILLQVWKITRFILSQFIIQLYGKTNDVLFRDWYKEKYFYWVKSNFSFCCFACYSITNPKL